MKNVKDSNFEEVVLNSDKPVIVDFWAPWCGPCVQMNPIIEGIAEDYADKVEVVKINLDDNPKTGSLYNITSIPTIILFHKGKVVKSVTGSLNKQGFEKHFSDVLL